MPACASACSRDLALTLVTQTALGSARMVQSADRHPAALRDDVTTPAGCTIGGLLMMEDGKIRSVIARAIEEATRIAAGLGADKTTNAVIDYAERTQTMKSVDPTERARAVGIDRERACGLGRRARTAGRTGRRGAAQGRTVRHVGAAMRSAAPSSTRSPRCRSSRTWPTAIHRRVGCSWLRRSRSAPAPQYPR